MAVCLSMTDFSVVDFKSATTNTTMHLGLSLL